jgi:hypothetical protein
VSCRRGTALAACAALTIVLTLPAGAPAHGAPRARPSADAPLVQSMVVGIGGGVLAPDRWVSAAPTALDVGGRSCAIAGGTPLSVLVAARRAGGPGFAVRDYGHCGSSPASSSELFVYSIGGERNRGQSGWEYKVEGAAGSTGAADPSGPFGNGRIGANQRVLWFWCQARGGGCQRTLLLSPARASVGRGGRLGVTVTAADNEGRTVPVAGAAVAIGSHLAFTDGHGHATLTVPSRAGGYWLTAGRRGMVPPFPGWIVVR